MAHLDAIIDQINQDNSLSPPLGVGDVTLSTPTAQSTTSGGKDTMVTVHAVPGSGYSGNVNVFYNRIDLAQFGTDFGLVSEDPFTSESFLTLLNQSRTADVESSDLLTFAIPTMETLVANTVSITADQDSVMWKGHIDVPVVFGIPATASILNEYVQQTMAQQLN